MAWQPRTFDYSGIAQNARTNLPQYGTLKMPPVGSPSPGNLVFDADAFVANRLSPEEKRLNSRIKNAEAKVGQAGGKLPPASPQQPFWMDALDALAGIGKMGSHQIYNWTDGDLKLNDIPLVDQLKLMGQGIKNRERQPYEFIPNPVDVVGAALGELGRKGKDTENILEENFNVKEAAADKDKGWNFLEARKGNLDWHDIASFTGDVALDPTTYVTLGAGAAVKNAGKAGQAAYKQTYDDMMREAVQITSKKNAEKWATKAAQEAAEKARNEAFRTGSNNLVGMYNPFTRNTTTIVGKDGAILGKTVPGSNTIRRTFQQVPDNVTVKQAAQLREAFDKIGIGHGQKEDVVSTILGRNVDDFTKLNQEELGWISSKIQDFAKKNPPPKDPFATGKKVNAKTNYGSLKNQTINDFMTYAKTSGKSYSELSNELNNILKNFKSTTRSTVDDLQSKGFTKSFKLGNRPKNMSDDFINSINDVFKPSNTGRSQFARKLDGTKVGNAMEQMNRWFGGGRYVPDSAVAKDPGLREAVNTIHDTNMLTHSQQRQAFDDIAQKVTKDFKLTADERNMVGYLLEGKTPTEWGSLDDIYKAHPNLRRAVTYAKQKYDEILKRELDLGIMPADRVRSNYTPHIYSKNISELDPSEIPEQIRSSAASNVTHGFTRERKGVESIQAFDEWKAANPESRLEIEKDVAKQMAIRQGASIRATNNREMLTQLEQMGFVSSNNKANWVKLEVVGVKGEVYAHPEIAKHLKAVNNLFNTLENEKEFGKIIKAINKVQNVWKSYVTSAIPGHYMKNMTGNFFNSRMAGVQMGSYEKSAKVMKAIADMEAGKKFDKKLVEEFGDVYQQAMDRGIIKTGYYSADFETGIDEAINYSLGKDSPLMKIPNAMRRNMGEPMEDWMRFAHFLDIYKKTGSYEKATDSVHKFLFNYFELSGTEKKIRAVIPFYTWMRNNIPLQLEQLAKNPRYAATYEKIHDQSTDGEVQPEWMMGSHIKYADGIPLVGGKFVNPYLPIQDLANASDWKTLINSTSPLLKIPFEAVANKRFFTGAPIDRYNDGQADIGNLQQGMLGYAVDQTGLGSQLADIVSPPASSTRIDEIMGALATQPRTVDPEKELLNQRYEYARKLDDTIKRMKAQGLLPSN